MAVEGAEQMISAAMEKRQTGSHGLNDRSSRSHLMIVFQRKTGQSNSSGATFTLVDLAGKPMHPCLPFEVHLHEEVSTSSHEIGATGLSSSTSI